MLNITGLNKFYYLKGFTAMRCKCTRVLSVIRHQLGREPDRCDVFIVMSRNHRLVRLFMHDPISYGLFEKRFVPGYEFMRVEFDDEDRPVYKIDWKDVVLLLESPVRKKLVVR